MPQSSRTMVTFRASCCQRASSDSVAVWKAEAAEAVAKTTTSRLKKNLFFRSYSPGIVVSAKYHNGVRLRCVRCFLLLYAGSAASVLGTSIPDAPEPWKSVKIDPSLPPTLLLMPHAPGGRAGRVWVRKLQGGVLVLGEVNGAAPVFPRSAKDLMKGDHVEVWLSLTPDLELPLGWGNQFEDVQLAHGEASCERLRERPLFRAYPEGLERKCRAWVKQQQPYRAYFRRLFVRQWQLAPGVAAEAFSLPAFKEIESIQDPILLEPKGLPQFTATLQSSAGYQFRVFIPWQIFPPGRQLPLRDLRLLVEVFSPATDASSNGPYSTTSAGRRYGEPAGFNALQFEHAKQYQLAACDYASPDQNLAVGLDMNDREIDGYFFPVQGNLITDIFVLQDYMAGYAYDPTGFSPITFSTHFFSEEMKPEEYVCGPILRYKHGSQATDLLLHFTEEEQEASLGKLGPTASVIVDSHGFSAHRTADGTLLVKSGPRVYWSRYGSGQCGACPRAGFQIYESNGHGEAAKLFSADEVVDCGQDIDIQLSADWRRISVYKYAMTEGEGSGPVPLGWSDNDYCLEGGEYVPCGSTKHIPPAAPRNLVFEPCVR